MKLSARAWVGLVIFGGVVVILLLFSGGG